MSRLRSWWNGLVRWDRRFVVGAFAGPLLVFLVPALIGHPLVGGDGLTQNLPLRELAGTDLRHGHLPLWDPYIWSGTPLLAGFNAGALYPSTLLFALLPATLAWSLTEAAVYTVALLGMFAFLRVHRLSCLASGIGALTWCGFGFMGAQLVHIASVQGWGLVTWVLVALQRLARGPRWHRGRWAAVLGAALGLLILVGDPESITEGSMLAGLYLIALLWRYRDISLLGWVCAGIAGGLALGGAQWLPGYAFAHASQRGQAAYSFFTAGSVSAVDFPLFFAPFLVGGYGRFGMPYYFGNYDLQEVSGYAGLIGLAAMFSLCLLWRRDPEARDWRMWYVIGGVGLVLALGGNTPLSHVMFHVPLYRLLRLPSRNLAWVDLAASVLAGFWVDRLLMARLREGCERRLRAGALVPSFVVVATLGSLLVAGTMVIATLAVSSRALAADHRVAIVIVTGVQSMIAIGLAVLVLRCCSLGRRRIAIGLVAVLVADLGFYGLDQGWVETTSTQTATGATPEASRLVSYLHRAGGGRFALYDPDRYDIHELTRLDMPDVNIFPRIESVQGYGSLAPAAYEAATGTHQQLTVSQGALSQGTFGDLGLGVLLAPANYFTTLVSHPPLTEAEKGFRLAYPIPPSPPSAPRSATAGGTVAAGQTIAWFWGKQIGVVAITGSVSATPSFQIGLVRAGGSIRWLPMSRIERDGSSFVLRGSRRWPLSALGVAVRPIGAQALRVSSVGFTNSLGYRYLLHGALTEVVRPGMWTGAGDIGDFTVFTYHRALRPDRLEPAGSGTVTTFPPRPWGTEVYVVRADRSSTMIRSVSYAKGWRAVLEPMSGPMSRSNVPTGSAKGSAPATGPVRDASVGPATGSVRDASVGQARMVSAQVTRHGLVQSIRVPSGRWRVTFSYHPALVSFALWLSLGGLVFLLGLALAPAFRLHTEQ